eukprot:gene29635-61278_t
MATGLSGALSGSGEWADARVGGAGNVWCVVWADAVRTMRERHWKAKLAFLDRSGNEVEHVKARETALLLRRSLAADSGDADCFVAAGGDPLRRKPEALALRVATFNNLGCLETHG